jgi:uncharacterized OsmC-like protein
MLLAIEIGVCCEGRQGRLGPISNVQPSEKFHPDPSAMIAAAVACCRVLTSISIVSDSSLKLRSVSAFTGSLRSVSVL